MKQQTKGGALHRLWQALPWLWMAAAYLFDLWYQLVPGKWIVDSDLASEMILSDLLNKEGTIISHNWLARTFGMAITLALFAAAMRFFVKCAGLGRTGLWMVGTLLWPFGQHYLVYAIYGGYYLVYTFFYMLVLALVLRSLNADMGAGLRHHGGGRHERRQAAHGVPRAALSGSGHSAGVGTAQLRQDQLEGRPGRLPQRSSLACGVAGHGGGRCGGVLRQQRGFVPDV